MSIRQAGLQKRNTKTADEYRVSGLRHQIDPNVVETLSVSVEARDAATEHVRRAEYTADEWDSEFGPQWRGWALHKAFLAGVTWQQDQEE